MLPVPQEGNGQFFVKILQLALDIFGATGYNN